MSDTQVRTVKVILLGDSGVGKSSLFQRFTSDKFKSDADPTMGASFGSRSLTVQGISVKFNIWDTAGQERFRSVTKMYYKDTQVAVLVYDITNRASFTNLKAWYQEIRDHGPADLSNSYTELAVVGNKEDLADQEAIQMTEAKQWASNVLALYKKTSAKSSFGVDTLFQELAEICAINVLSSNSSRIVLKQGKAGEKRCKC